MEVFRISKETYANSLNSSGSANRWNIRGQHVLYAGSTRSLSTLELVVHKGAVTPSENYKVMVISIADDDALIKQIKVKDLPVNWRTVGAYSTLQHIGSDWINSQETLILKVPSAVIPHEHNYVINTDHPEFKNSVSLIRAEAYFWDLRLV